MASHRYARVDLLARHVLRAQNQWVLPVTQRFLLNMKPLIRGVAVSALAMCISMSSMAAGVADTAALFLRADPGSYVGYTLPSEGQTFTQGAGGPIFSSFLWGSYITEFYSSSPGDFTLVFSAPRYSAVDNLVKARPLEVGFYDNARRVMSATDMSPGMAVSGFARGYNRLSGWFNVLEVSHGSSGEITSLAVDFAEYGENLTKSGPALYGSFRYNSAIPLTTSIPEPGSQALFLIGGIGLVAGVRKARKDASQK